MDGIPREIPTRGRALPRKYHRFLCRRFCATYRYTYHGAKNPKGGERKEKKTEYRPKRGQQAVLGRRGAQEWGRGLLVAG